MSFDMTICLSFTENTGMYIFLAEKYNILPLGYQLDAVQSTTAWILVMLIVQYSFLC